MKKNIFTFFFLFSGAFVGLALAAWMCDLPPVFLYHQLIGALAVSVVAGLTA